MRLFSPLGSQVLTPVAFCLVANSSSSSSSLPLQVATAMHCKGHSLLGRPHSRRPHRYSGRSSRGTPVTLALVQMFPQHPPPHPHSTPALGTPHGRDWVNYRLLVSEQWESRGLSKFHHAQDSKEIQRAVWVSPGAPESCFWEAGLHF